MDSGLAHTGTNATGEKVMDSQDAKDSRVAILRDGTLLPVSRAGYARLSKLL